MDVKDAERHWHDSYFREHARQEFPGTLPEFLEKFKRLELTQFCDGGWSYWADPRAEVLKSLRDLRGKSVLDYGCGSGRLGIYLSAQGANVWGFDLSGEGTRIAGEMAAAYGLTARFEEMDAENLSYPDNFFDLVVSFGVLHHVIKYPLASSHLHRILKPGASAIFVETLWDNPLINFARRFTLLDSDAGDARLTESSIYEFARGFREIQLEKRHLLYMCKRFAKPPDQALSESLRPRPFWRFVKAVDRRLLRLTPLRRYCGEVIIYLRK